MRLSRGKTECRTERVYIVVSSNFLSKVFEKMCIYFYFHFSKLQDSIRDKLTPLEVEMSYNIRERKQQIQHRDRRSLPPVINESKGTVQRDSINIQKNCGPDNVCEPDLHLRVESAQSYIYGSEELLMFNITIWNNGEDAFEAAFYMSIPEKIDYRKSEQVGPRDPPISCTPPTTDTNHMLQCDLGNPLSSGKSVNFIVTMLPPKVGIAPLYEFSMETNSTNAEPPGHDIDNKYKKTVTIEVTTKLVVHGAQLSNVIYNTSGIVPFENITEEAQIGPEITPSYSIRNDGPSVIEEAIIYFVWPVRAGSGEHLVYLLNKPESTTNMACVESPYVNPGFSSGSQVKIDKTLSTRSILAERGVDVSLLEISHSTSSSHESKSFRQGYAVGPKDSHNSETVNYLAQQENRESSGDASLIHNERAKQAQKDSQYYEVSGSSNWSGPAHDYSTSLHQSQGHRTSGSGVHIAGAFGAGGSGTRKIDDFSSEGSVDQEISNIQNTHGQAQSSLQTTQNARNNQATSESTGPRRLKSQQDGQPYTPGLIVGASQSDNNFQYGTMEVNNIGRNNVDDEIHRGNEAQHFSSSSSGGSGSSYSQDGSRFQQSGRTNGGTNSHSEFRSSSKSYQSKKFQSKN